MCVCVRVVLVAIVGLFGLYIYNNDGCTLCVCVYVCACGHAN